MKKRLQNFLKSQIIIRALSSKLIVSLSKLKIKDKINYRDIVLAWESSVYNGKIFNSIKNFLKPLKIGDDETDDMIIILGHEILSKQIGTINKVLEMDISTTQKIGLIEFLIKESYKYFEI